jgi:hypothetical protein
MNEVVASELTAERSTPALPLHLLLLPTLVHALANLFASR